MPRLVQKSDLDEIIKYLSLFSDGASLEQLHKVLSIALPSHTLRRRLSALIKEGRVFTKGNARALRYFAVVNDEAENQTSEELLIPLSDIAKTVLKIVNQPIQRRKPVGYNRKFLDNYYPNKTFYLSETVRKKLFQLGKTDGDRPAGTYARNIFNRILIDLAWNSSRLEGNTYSLLETELLLEHNEIALGKNITETQMILNHKAAIEFLVDSADYIAVDKQTILNLHALLSDNLLVDPRACGRVRSKMVGISESVYHPLAISHLINECLDQVLNMARVIQDPFEQSFFLMVHLPYLQPFEDVNKRVSRLAANIPLIKYNFSPLSFMDVPQKLYISGLLAIYEQNKVDLLRDVFVWAYERSCALYSLTRQTLGEPDPLRLRYRNILKEVVAYIVIQKMDKKSSILHIKKTAKTLIPVEDQSLFIKTVEVELKSLHEGNIARYKLRPEQFEDWKKNWK